MEKFWFVSYHILSHTGIYGFGQTYVYLPDGPFNVRKDSDIVMRACTEMKSIVILNYFEVDEATYLENCVKPTV